jgi:predicted anti-sigma-YlaC factor YlaD
MRRATRRGFDRHLVRLALLALVLALPGCALRQALVNRVGDALADGGEVYASDPDVELVGAATPFGLKLLESLSAESPSHRGLLLALARGYTQYAYVWVEAPADVLEPHNLAAAYAERVRARNLYLRARDYGLRGLELAHPRLREHLARNPREAVGALSAREVALAYWSAAAWGAAISLSKDDPARLAELPAVRALAARALELDEGFEHGSPHVLALSLVMSGSGSDTDRRREAHRHLERAIALSGGYEAGPYVAYAEAVSIPLADRGEFETLMASALAVDPDARPADRLANTFFQRRARWLRERADELFAP